MKGISKVAMGVTLVVLVSLALVLGLLLVLLVDLYRSLLFRKSRPRTTSSTAATAAAANAGPPSRPSPSLNPSAAPLGVLHAPRSSLFPSVSNADNYTESTKYHRHSHAVGILECQIRESINAVPHRMGVVSVPSPSSFKLRPTQEHPRHISTSPPEEAEENLVYISNPIYYNDGLSQGTKNAPLFKTSGSSQPSGLETEGSSGEEDGELL